MATTPAIKLIDQRYQVLSELGRGGMGVVYKAEDTKMDRVVAIKVMTAHIAEAGEYRERFLREAKSLAKMQHPNIVVVYDHGEHCGAPYIAMEFVEGTPLDRIIQAGVRLSLVTKLDYVVQVCHALAYAHSFGIVHRDVKPANIVVLEGGQQIKLLDFGIARAGAASSLSRSGLAMGTIPYMSPQQIKGQKDIDHRTDIFSAGVVLYELLSGTLPWTDESEYELVQKIVTQPYPPLPNLADYPPMLNQVLERALAKDTGARYANAELMASELADVEVPLKERMIEEARASLDFGDLLRSQQLVSEILRIDTRHREALELQSKLQHFPELKEKVEKVRNLRLAAEQAFRQKRYQDALDSVEEAISLNCTNPELLHFRDTVRKQLRRKQDVHRKLELAKRAEEIDDIPAAQEFVKRALEEDPNDTQARMMKSLLDRRAEADDKQRRIVDITEEAQRRLSSRQFTGARELIRELKELNPNCPALPGLEMQLAEAEAQERRSREKQDFVHEIQKALTADQLPTALALSDRALAAFPADSALLKLRAQAQARKDSIDRQRAIEDRLAEVARLRSAGEVEAALRLMEAAIQSFGETPRLRATFDEVREEAERQRTQQAQEAILAQAAEAMRDSRFDSAVRVLSAGAIEFPLSQAIRDALHAAREEAARARAEQQKKREREVAEALEDLLKREASPDIQVEIAEETLANHPDNDEVRHLATKARERQKTVAGFIADAKRLETTGDFHGARRQWEQIREVCPQYPRVNETVARLTSVVAQKPAPAIADSVPSPPAVSASATQFGLRSSPATPASQVAVAAPTEAPATPRSSTSPRVEERHVSPPRHPAPKKGWALLSAAALIVVGTIGYWLFPKPPADTASLNITVSSVPEGARVSIAGTECDAPCNLRLPKGTYPVHATLTGFTQLDQQVKVVSERQAILLTLSKVASPLGRVQISTNIDEVKLLVNGQMEGITSGRRAALSLAPGTYEVEAQKTGFVSQKKSITVADNSDSSISFELSESLSAAVEHQDPDIIVSAAPAGARVYFDGKQVGQVRSNGIFSRPVKPGPHDVEVAAEGFERYKVRVNAEADKTVSITPALTATQVIIDSFASAASELQPGEATELHWRTTNAREVSIDNGVGSVGKSGSVRIAPRESTTYTLSARSGSTSTSRSVTVRIAASTPRGPTEAARPAVVEAFEAGLDSIREGQQTKLTWSTRNANRVTIEPGIGEVEMGGSQRVSPKQTTTYVLTAYGASGAAVKKETTIAVTTEAKIEASTRPETTDAKTIEAAINAFYIGYRSMSSEELSKAAPKLPKRLLKDLEAGFKSMRQIDVEHRCDSPNVSGDTATSRCMQTLSWTDSSGKRTAPRTIATVFSLRKVGSSWYIENMAAAK